MKLTTASIKALELPPGASDKTFWDGDIGGFGLRLREGGSRNWVVQYDLAGRTRRVTLGSIALLDVGAARAKARNLLAHTRLGGDPAAEKRAYRARAAETFAAILPSYLIDKQRDCRQSSFKQIERRLQKLAQPLTRCPSPPLTAAASRAWSLTSPTAMGQALPPICTARSAATSRG
jgi:Arm DNA-binding domain